MKNTEIDEDNEKMFNLDEKKENRTMEFYSSLGHKRMSAAKAIRMNCLECCGGQQSEVARCAHTQCYCFPFRFGKSVWKTVKDVETPPDTTN